MLDEQRIADVLENGAPSAGRSSLLCELTGKRLDHLDDRGDLALVARQDHAFRKRVRNHDHMLRVYGFEPDRPAGKDLFVLVSGDPDGGGLILARFDRAKMRPPPSRSRRTRTNRSCPADRSCSKP